MASDQTPSAASDVQWCGDDQPHEAHPWSDVICPGFRNDVPMPTWYEDDEWIYGHRRTA